MVASKRDSNARLLSSLEQPKTRRIPQRSRGNIGHYRDATFVRKRSSARAFKHPPSLVCPVISCDGANRIPHVEFLVPDICGNHEADGGVTAYGEVAASPARSCAADDEFSIGHYIDIGPANLEQVGEG